MAVCDESVHRMITEMHGDVFCQNADVVAHQVNCEGIMNGGIAKFIRQRYMHMSDFHRYQKLCEVNGKMNLGHVFYCRSAEIDRMKPFVIANCFGENKIHPAGGGPVTNYEALRQCLRNVADVSRKHQFHIIAVPAKIGCGLAGGDWNYVKNDILYPLFQDLPDITLIIASL